LHEITTLHTILIFDLQYSYCNYSSYKILERIFFNFNSQPWIIPNVKVDLDLTTNQKSNLKTDKWLSKLSTFIDTNYFNYSVVSVHAGTSETGKEAIVCMPNKTVKYQLKKYASYKTARSYALMSALQSILQLHSPKVILLSSSLPSMSWNNNAKTEINTVIMEEYFKIISSGINLIFVWIPSQIEPAIISRGVSKGITLIDLQMSTNVHKISCTTEDMLKFVAEVMQNKWNRNWTDYKASNLHKSINNFYALSTHKNIRRREQVALSRIRTGHSKLSHLHLIKKAPPPTCEQCKTPLNLEHIFKVCPRYNSQRQLTGYNHEAILHSKEDQEKIISFCKATNIFLDI